jgi:hypothetical protein
VLITPPWLLFLSDISSKFNRRSVNSISTFIIYNIL